MYSIIDVCGFSFSLGPSILLDVDEATSRTSHFPVLSLLLQGVGKWSNGRVKQGAGVPATDIRVFI